MLKHAQVTIEPLSRRQLQLLHTLDETRAEFTKFHNAIRAIQDRSPSEVYFRMIKVECKLVKEQLMSKAREISSKLMDGLLNKVREFNLAMTDDCQNMLQLLKV